MIDEAFLERKMEEHRVPAHLRRGLKSYILNGTPPGGFLRAVLSNDLVEAFGKADDISYPAIGNVVRFLYNAAPAACWRNRENLNEWVRAGGLVALRKTRNDADLVEADQ